MPDVKFSNQYPYTDFHELNLDWVIDTVKHWSELVGKTIQSITLTGTTGLVDTYTINYSDGTTSTFNVTNGRGIVSIVMTSVAGLVATYTVTYNDGTTSTFDVTDGRGIVSIEKTATVGLTDTYTITYNDGTESTFEVENGAEAIDATLTLAGYAADAKAVGDALDLKQNAADPAGLAENLTPYSPDSGVSQDQPFILQGTGTGNGESVVDTGSYAQIQNKNGNSAGVNQLFPDYPDSTNTIDGVTITAAGGYITLSGLASADIFNAYELHFTPVSGRKYLIMADASGTPAASGATWQWYLSGGGLGLDYEISRKIYTATDNSQVTMRLAVYNGVNVNIKSMMPRVIDLSLWFGSNDRIPSHLLSHPEDFGRYYAGSLAYNAGTLESADGTVLTSIGRNVWDEEWEQGGIDSSSGQPEADSSRIRSKNLIRSIPGATYYIHGARISWIEYDSNGTYLRAGFAGSFVGADADFTISADAHFIKFFTTATYGGTYKNDITISLYYPGESGYDQYYPYRVLAEVDTGSEVLRSAGAVADEKLPSGVITRAISAEITIDLTSLTFVAQGGGQSHWYSSTQPFASYKLPASNSDTANARCNKLCVYAYSDLSNNVGMGITSTGRLGISNEVYQNLASYGTITVICELATPTTEQGTSFSGASANNFAIEESGSMEWTQTNGVPQGVEIFYPYNYAGFLDQLIRAAGGDAGQIPTANPPTADGTYTFKATVSGGAVTYSWVLE